MHRNKGLNQYFKQLWKEAIGIQARWTRNAVPDLTKMLSIARGGSDSHAHRACIGKIMLLAFLQKSPYLLMIWLLCVPSICFFACRSVQMCVADI